MYVYVMPVRSNESEKKTRQITAHYQNKKTSMNPVLEFVGCFHEDFQLDLYYASHRSLVWLSPVFGANASRIPQ